MCAAQLCVTRMLLVALPSLYSIVVEQTTPGRLSAFLVPSSRDAYSMRGVARDIMPGSRDMSAMVTAAERLGALREALADASVDG